MYTQQQCSNPDLSHVSQWKLNLVYILFYCALPLASNPSAGESLVNAVAFRKLLFIPFQVTGSCSLFRFQFQLFKSLIMFGNFILYRFFQRMYCWVYTQYVLRTLQKRNPFFVLSVNDYLVFCNFQIISAFKMVTNFYSINII